MKSTTVRAVCFSPAKRKRIDSCCKEKTPVKIKTFRLETKSNSEDIIVDDNVKIEECPEIAFERKEIPTNLTIAKLKSICIGQLITIKAKVASLQPIKDVNDGALKLVEGILIDPTDSIRITLWEEHINDIQEGNTYI